MLMKKLLIFAIASLAMIACSKEAAPTDDSQPVSDKIIFDIKINNSDATKAVKTAWESGDVVYVFFNNIALSDTPKYLTLTYDGSKWSAELHNIATSEFAESGQTMSAVFFPFASGSLDIIREFSYYSFRKDDMAICSYFLTATKTPYTFTIGGDANTLSGTLDMIPNYEIFVSGDNYFQFCIDGFTDEAQASHYWLEEANFSPIVCAGIHSNGWFDMRKLPAGTPVPGHFYKGAASFTGVLGNSLLGNANDYNFTIYSNEGEARPFDYKYVKTLSGNRTFYSQTINLPALSSYDWTYGSEPQYIDLGLSVKWAYANADNDPASAALAYDPVVYGVYYGSGYGYEWSSVSSGTMNGLRVPTKDEYEELLDAAAYGLCLGTMDYECYQDYPKFLSERYGWTVYGGNGMCVFFPIVGSSASYWTCTEESASYGYSIYASYSAFNSISALSKDSYALVRPVQAR